MKIVYKTPETDEIVVRPEKALLIQSLTTGSSTGENLTEDSEYNPW